MGSFIGILLSSISIYIAPTAAHSRGPIFGFCIVTILDIAVSLFDVQFEDKLKIILDIDKGRCSHGKTSVQDDFANPD